MMNTVFQENLNEMIHHAQQKIGNTSRQRPHRAAPETRSHLGSPLRGKPAAPQRQRFVFPSTHSESNANQRTAAFPGTAARFPPCTGIGITRVSFTRARSSPGIPHTQK